MTEPPDLPPLVMRVEPAAPPRPGLLGAVVLTFGYWLSLIGGMMAVVFVAMLAVGFFGKNTSEPPVEGASDIERMPPALRAALGWAFPAGYACGLIYSIAVIRKVVGRGWTREFGLNRLPPVHLLLGFLALPGFVLLSDALARFVQPLDAIAYRTFGVKEIDLGGPLRAIFESFHWSFAVFAIGIGPGVVEELWCRGFLGRGLLARHGALLGVLFSSAFFGLLHLWPPSYVLVTAAMGACLHFAYLASRSLWVPIAMHFANNSFAALAATGSIRLESVEVQVAANETAVVAASVVALAACGFAMWRTRPITEP
jgi:membrane protease YdiL (CAAX protease family)